MRRQRRPRRPASPLASLRTRRSPASTGAGLVPEGARQRASRRLLPKQRGFVGHEQRYAYGRPVYTRASLGSYSPRSATTGSTRIARRAGTQLARNDTTTSSSATPAKVTGSNGLT